jgi:L-malate glycosyltransferase
MSEIVISGYYGFKNAGDELILKTIVGDLRFYKPNIKISVLSATPKETSKTYNVHSINRWNIFSIIAEILKSQMLLSGSGGLFQDTTGYMSLWYYLMIISLAKFFNKKVFIYAVGIGEIKHPINKYFIKYCFNKVDFITVRTIRDKEMLESFGIKQNIIVTADPVFGIDLPNVVINDTTKKKKIGIIIRKTKDWKNDVVIFSNISKILTEKFNAKIIFIPFQESSDLKLLKNIKNKTNGIADIYMWNNLDEMLKLFSQLDIVISMRLHGLILAAKYDILFVPIPRYSKIVNFLYAIEETDILQINKITAENIYNYILDKTSSRKEYFNKISTILVDLKNKAKKTAELCIAQLVVTKNQ